MRGDGLRGQENAGGARRARGCEASSFRSALSALWRPGEAAAQTAGMTAGLGHKHGVGGWLGKPRTRKGPLCAPSDPSVLSQGREVSTPPRPYRTTGRILTEWVPRTDTCN